MPQMIVSYDICDLFNQEVKNIKEELATRLNSSETADLMKEKDEQIRGLMEEGMCFVDC